MAKKAPTFACRSCGDTFSRWAGRCPSCGAMNAIGEITAAEAAVAARGAEQAVAAAGLAVEALDAADAAPIPRLLSGIAELDRVLGGGLPAGGVVLLGGEPGIGKSTLLAQVAGAVARERSVLYVTAEESTAQVRARVERLGATAAGLKLSASSDARAVAGAITSGDYRLVVVDSIQLLALDGVEGEPGGVSQCRACAATLVEAAKRAGCALVIVGHVTKDGGLAGPRLLEHLVDTVLSFEGDRYADLRALRAAKNRYGSTSEIGLFRMGGQGLVEVPDPSGIFIADRDPEAPGSCIVPTLEGNRCLLVEVQALVNPTEYPQPVRRVSGLDANRVAMVLAVLSRRLRLPLGTCDVFVNATGGARVLEPAADLAIALAVASAWRDQAVPRDLVALGEVGLAGELRPAPRYELRAAEGRRLGFQRLLGPGGGSGRGRLVATRLGDAIRLALGEGGTREAAQPG
jgi:DNA repair protein RadA/Sms